MSSRVWRTVAIINEHDVPHRKGWRPSDFALPTGDHLRDEVEELVDALADHNDLVEHKGSPAYLTALADSREEVADVIACAYQIAYRLGMSEETLHAEIERKLRLRFIGVPEPA